MITMQMKLATLVLALGLAIVAAFPVLTGAPLEAAEVGGVWPEAIVPVGYFVAGLGAAWLVVAWLRARAV